MDFEFGEIDLLDPPVHDDPWPLYTWLREECPLYKDANGVWCVSRYDDIIAVSRDPDTFTSSEGNRPLLPADDSFINLEGAAHTERRGLIADKFSAKGVASLEGQIRSSVTGLIDDVIESGRCDFVDAIAAPLPARLIMGMTGIPPEYMDSIRHWMDVFIQGGSGPIHVTEQVNEAFFNFGAVHMDMVDKRRTERSDDLVSLWCEAKVNGTPLTEDQLLFEHTMMLVGGSETSRNALSGGIEMLTKVPEQRQYLIDHPEGIPNAIEEMIRWITPFISMSRTATRDVELLGHTIRKGEEIMMLYPAANRDPRKFEDPERFDVQRKSAQKQLSFGFGRHFCIGARLARAEMRITLEEMLTRLPDWELDGDSTWSTSSFIRGPTALPIRYTPGKRTYAEGEGAPAGSLSALGQCPMHEK